LFLASRVFRAPTLQPVQNTRASQCSVVSLTGIVSDGLPLSSQIPERYKQRLRVVARWKIGGGEGRRFRSSILFVRISPCDFHHHHHHHTTIVDPSPPSIRSIADLLSGSSLMQGGSSSGPGPDVTARVDLARAMRSSNPRRFIPVASGVAAGVDALLPIHRQWHSSSQCQCS
jgi:hypothetical protein